MGRTIQDFENEGFTVYEEGEGIKTIKADNPIPAPETEPSKLIIMDNRDVLTAIKDSNEALQNGLAQLIYSMESKPDGFTLDIERDSRGFMTRIRAKVNK
jgi:hypothetical protein